MPGVVLNTIFLVREVRRNERQDSFLNAVTHELKTPIASIRLYLDTLERRTLDEPQRRKFYSIMRSDSDRLLATVEQVLKAGELGQRARQQNRAVLDLQPLVAECIAVTIARHHLKPDTIQLAPVPGQVKLRVNGIAEDLRTAVLNLLDNAVKYSPAGVHIRATLAITGYTNVSLAITDTGIGIPRPSSSASSNGFTASPAATPSRLKAPDSACSWYGPSPASTAAASPHPARGPTWGTTMTLTLPLSPN